MNTKHTTKILVLSLIATFALATPSHALSDNPIFVEISTEWCGACKRLEPIIEELEKEYGGQVTFLKLDATSEESVMQSAALASKYGVEEFFLGNRNAFPRVGVFCTNGSLPDHNLLGARDIDSYREILNNLALEGGLCSLSDSAIPEQADLGPGRPGDPQYEEIPGERPQVPELADRPKSAMPDRSGRPGELSFWQAGEAIPSYAYFQYWVLPECTGNSNVICSNYGLEDSTNTQSPPVFTPWSPNATRNEKGFDELKKG